MRSTGSKDPFDSAEFHGAESGQLIGMERGRMGREQSVSVGDAFAVPLPESRYVVHVLERGAWK